MIGHDIHLANAMMLKMTGENTLALAEFSSKEWPCHAE